MFKKLTVVCIKGFINSEHFAMFYKQQQQKQLSKMYMPFSDLPIFCLCGLMTINVISITKATRT